MSTRLTRQELAEALAAGFRLAHPTWSVTIAADKDGDPEIAIVGAGPDRGLRATAGTENAWTDYQAGVPVERLVERTVAAIPTRADVPATWPDSRARLRVQMITDQQAVAMQQAAEEANAELDLPDPPRLLIRPWAFGASFRVCLDSPRSIFGLYHQHLDHWGVAEAEVWRVALANTRLACQNAPLHKRALSDGPTYRVWDEPSGYTAARLLWPELGGPLPPTRRRLIVAPQRDMVASLDLSMRDLDRPGGVGVMFAAIEALAKLYRENLAFAYRALPHPVVLIDNGGGDRRWKQVFPEPLDTLAPPAESLIP